MARQRPASVGHVSHEAQVSVDKLSKEIVKRGELETVERRETESRAERLAERQASDSARSSQELLVVQMRRRARAHSSVMGTKEPVAGAPRSGSA